jgi:cathepsin L
MNYVNKDSLKISENYTSKNEIKYKKKQSNKLSIKSIDWRRKGVVNPIKDQDKCGSCWAFTSVSAIESHVAINYGILLNLSEQNLVDCATGKDGCDGASVFDAFDYIKSNGGIDTQDSYPYVSGSTRRVNI